MKSSDNILNIVKRVGPCLTSDLIQEMRALGISEITARKRIQREKDIIRLAGLRFEKNARFVYTEEQYGTDLFWERLEKAFHKAGNSYWCTVVRLKSKGGIVPKSNFSCITGSPLARKRHLSPQRILDRLMAINLLEETGDGDVKYIQFKPKNFVYINLSAIEALNLAENIALQSISNWARRIGFGSYKSFALRGDINPPQVSGIIWDLSAPSYVRPLVQITENNARPGFIVCDINLHTSIEEEEAVAFIRKCNLASAPPGVAPIMPMLIGYSFSSQSFSLLRSKGILAITIENLFGEEVAKALKDLVTMLTDLGAKASADPSYIIKVMNSLSKIVGNTDNLLGALFELVIGCIVKDVEGGFLQTGKRITNKSGKPAEIDVYLDITNKNEILIIECKAKNPSSLVSADDLKKWYEDRVPLIYETLSNEGSSSKKFKFELWTNNDFHPEAQTWFNSQIKDCDNYSVEIKNGEAIKAYALKLQNTSLRDTLNEFYFRSNLQKAISIKNKP